MSRKAMATLLVAVWFVLFSLEFTGFFGPLTQTRPNISASTPAFLPTLGWAEIPETKMDGGVDHSLAWSANFITVPSYSGSSPSWVEIVDGSPRLYEFHQTLRL